MDAEKRLHVLSDEWTGCTRCGLSELRSGPRIVFGDGPCDADVMMITDAPDAIDMEVGVLFAGDYGRLLGDIAHSAGVRFDDIFCTALVGCYPYTEVEDPDDEDRVIVHTRPPDSEEIEACSARLNSIIYAVDPRLIIAMGDLPWKTLVRAKDRGRGNTSIKKAQGKIFRTYIPGVYREVAYPVLATLSPKQLINNPSKAKHGPIPSTTRWLRAAANYIDQLHEFEEIDTERTST